MPDLCVQMLNSSWALYLRKEGQGYSGMGSFFVFLFPTTSIPLSRSGGTSSLSPAYEFWPDTSFHSSRWICFPMGTIHICFCNPLPYPKPTTLIFLRELFANPRGFSLLRGLQHFVTSFPIRTQSVICSAFHMWGMVSKIEFPVWLEVSF